MKERVESPPRWSRTRLSTDGLRWGAVAWLSLSASLGSVVPADPADPVAGRGHWAFRPLGDPAPPVVASGWGRTPIDAFVEARLRDAGLAPAADAERRDLLRRIHFHLTGLPPTPEEVRGFLEDERADAIERVVDRLLASPPFGERWGRHWLDLARYADSNGLDENFLFREAWRYRNWVIDAVNADLPFDRFVLEQIAGDLLPFETIEQRDRQRIAAGFLVIGPKVLLGNDPKRQRMEVADEQIDTIGKAILGQTLGCARCHDHKFDPIPTADYYALAGILTSTEVMEQRFMLNEQRVMERLAGLGEDGESLDADYERYWRERPQMQAAADRAGEALAKLESGDAAGLAEIAGKHPEAVAEAAADGSQPIENRIQTQLARLHELRAVLARPPAIPPRAMIPADAADAGDEAIRIAGQFDRPGETVPRGFLRVVSDRPRPELPEGASGRLELARWLTDVEHGAGALTARVMVNRIWHHLIGKGIVRTVDNFGRTGEPPTHPELLEHLARRFVDSGWSVKSVVRDIVLSRTFGMASAHGARAAEIDPENELLWRAHRRRLDPEALRDAMLAVAGRLDLEPVESTVAYLGDQATAVGGNENRRRTDFDCRSVYLPVIRNDLPELFEVFDFADPHTTTGARPRTSSATQGLFLMNDAMVMEMAEATARRVLEHEGHRDDGERVDRLFALLFAASPTDGERYEMLAFIGEAASRFAAEGEDEPGVRAWALACHAMFSMSRFQFLD